MLSNLVQSDTITLSQIIEDDYFFQIPIYQRRYVWGEEQIEKLLGDICSAFVEGKDVYYLGTVLVQSGTNSDKKSVQYFELIDGQQRFTTLWLLSVVLHRLCKKADTECILSHYRFKQSEGNASLHRIDFVNRAEVKDFFQSLFDDADQPEKYSEYLSLLPVALQTIETFFSRQDIESKNKNESNDSEFRHLNYPALAEFICSKVEMVFTRIPESFDLNKLFEVINNRGLQLQHHEILKARLLHQLKNSPEDRGIYNLMWVACADMSGYLERNLQNAVSGYIKIDNKADQKQETAKAFVLRLFKTQKLSNGKDISLVLGEIMQKNRSENNSVNNNGISLEQVLADTLAVETFIKVNSFNEYITTDDLVEDIETTTGSILNFSQLLQHTLRLFLFSQGKANDVEKIHDSSLLGIFDNAWFNVHKPQGEDIKKFIECLWEVRFQFDSQIVRWVKDEKNENEKHLELKRLIEKENGLFRQISIDDKGFVLLQSMLYHSQERATQYWMTPFINYLLFNSSSEPYLYLRHLDLYLLSSKEKSLTKLLDRTRLFVREPWRKAELLDIKSELEKEKNLGTSCPHYWFYKLEFILWYLLIKDKKEWSSFRITSRNSIEHVSPQHREKWDDENFTDIMLDHFGNLALVTGSYNSEVSNRSFKTKKSMWNDKKKVKVDSLKLDLIYEHEKWDDEIAASHQTKMLEYFDQYSKSFSQDTNNQNN